MKELLKHIAAHTRATGGASGTNLVKLHQETGRSIEQLRLHLNKLHGDGKIQMREGINHQLIFAR